MITKLELIADEQASKRVVSKEIGDGDLVSGRTLYVNASKSTHSFQSMGTR